MSAPLAANPMAPPDQDVRDELTSGLATTFFVNAGAGSGKTTALVARIVSLVVSGVAIDRIAAITFTEAAAAELRLRIRRELERRLGAAGDSGDRATAASCAAALDGLDAAAIQTLHSFALSILRRFPIEAGLPPAVDVVDDVTAVLRFEDRMDEMLDDLYDSPGWLARIERLGCFRNKVDDDLRSLARLLDDHYDRLGVNQEVGDPGPLPPLDVADLIAGYEALLDRRSECLVEDDGLLAHLEGGVADHVAMLTSTDPATVAAALDSPIGPGTSGRATNWPQDACADIKSSLKELKVRCGERSAAESARAFTPFVGYLAGRALAAAARRRAAGTLSFHDLLVAARDLVARDEAVRRELHETWGALLLDEFQDTDPLQLELATLIATTAADVTDVDWRDLPVPDGRLFFVGDPKQSIYRFRRADIALYLSAERHHADGCRELTANFRSAPGIIRWVNAVFSRLIVRSDSDAADLSPRYQALEEVRRSVDERPSVHVVGEGLDMPVRAIRNESARELVGMISEMCDGRWPIEDPTSGVVRPVTLADVVVLVPTRLAVPALERAFSEADMPYVLATRSLIWSSQEVRDVLAVLRVLDRPTDAAALVAALRSPLLGCGDDDLLEWHRAGGRWHLDAALPAGQGGRPVAVALQRLLHVQRSVRWFAVDEVVGRVLSEFSAVELALLDTQPRDRWRRLRTLVDQSQLFVEQHGGGVSDFLRWVELQSSDAVTVAQPVVSEDDHPAVRVMTVHGAKGLEFPVCALFGLTTDYSNRSGIGLSWGDGPLPAVGLSSRVSTPDYDARKPLEDQLDVAERRRLLYVAATRARDHLIICTHHKGSTNGSPTPSGKEFHVSFGRMILDHLPTEGEGDWWRRVPSSVVAPTAETSDDESVTEATPTHRPTPVPDPVAVADAARRIEEFDVEHAARRVAPAVVISATAVATAGATEADRWAGAGRGDVGPAIGRAVHVTMERLDLDDLDALDRLADRARAHATAEGLDGGAADTVVATVTAMVGHSELRRVLEGKHWRELFVAAPVGDGVIEGYIDLLGEDPDGSLVILDYKSDAVGSEGDVDRKVDIYRLQAAAYALAVTTATGREVSRAGFVFVRDGVAEIRWLDDLAAAITEARWVVADRMGAGASGQTA